jgi:hypothetical protein
LYPETKEKVEESGSLSSDDSALTGSGYIIDSDSDADMLIDTSSYVDDDDIYPSHTVRSKTTRNHPQANTA